MLELFEQPELMAALLEGMQDGVSIVSPEGVALFVNDAFCRMTGFDREELLGKKPPHPYWPVEELEAIAAAFRQTLSCAPDPVDLTFRTKDGRRFPVIVAPSTVRDKSGVVFGHIATVKDISEHRRLERALSESEQRFRSIAENPFDFVVVIDREYRYQYINHAAPGLSREALIGKATPFDFILPSQHAVMREAFETTFRTGQATSYEVYVPELDTWYASIVGPIREHERVTSLSILTRDVTEQKRAEEALRRSEHQLREAHKMETIGTLAGGIAHDLNNILTPILAYSELAQLTVRTGDPLQSHLHGIEEAALRGRDLVRRILLFSRREEPQKCALDLRTRVLEDTKLLKATMSATIELALDLPATPIWVLADPTQFHQLLANLATNALHAMRDSVGKVAIKLRQVTFPEREGELPPPSGAGSYAVLTMTDTGPGMDEETQRRAFEPFFTTKEKGSGTGLGLSIVHGIARDHGGDVTLVSAPGQGAMFTLRLPVLAHKSEHPDPSSLKTREMPKRVLRVMCLDDQASVVAVARAVLEHAGHKVCSATSPLLALEIFKSDPRAVDVLLTDQTMPHMQGTALIVALRALRPDLPCVLMTGYADERTLESARSLGILEIVSKPFSATALVTAIEHAGEDARAWGGADDSERAPPPRY